MAALVPGALAAAVSAAVPGAHSAAALGAAPAAIVAPLYGAAPAAAVAPVLELLNKLASTVSLAGGLKAQPAAGCIGALVLHFS
eukprot:1157609-Pelagomonas_calceolata.AAC.6